MILHPADVRGRYTVWRRIAAVALIAFYVSLPWLSINGAPAVFLDIGKLRFHFFGLTLAAQDLWLAFFLITGLGFSLFYVTALFGRIWCGWACPQTVFLEHVYRRIERWLEGDSNRRRQLDRAPWNAERWLRRGTKHILFILVSLVITHVLLSYFVSLPRVFEMISDSPLQHWGVFLFIVVSTGLIYFNFAWFREQLCIIICPYGRLQSALIDDHSLVIGYDEKRGEPRGKVGTPGAADCIACNRCVEVCPTGIDIRQGLQLECIGCANCIDACDEIMDRVGRPRGLVRYDSLNGFAGLKTRLLRPRIVLYTALLLLGASVAGIAATRYQPATLGITRIQGAPYFVDAGYVRNQFFVRAINKRDIPAVFSLDVVVGAGGPSSTSGSGWEEGVEVPGGGEEVRPLIVLVPRADYTGGFPLILRLTSTSGGIRLEREAEFVGPDPQLFHASDHDPAP